ncbi:MAG: hypothetical protein ACR2H0_06690 [Candidatus Limnocylindrales bacterium]
MLRCCVNRIGPPLVFQRQYADQLVETLRNAIADSKDSFLSLGSIARTGDAALLSTVTVVATAALQFYLERVV